MVTDIIFVDLDSTLRKTKSGKPYPIYKTDYVVIQPVIDYINNLIKEKDYKVIIVTNQSQIRNSEKQLETYEFNLKDIIKKLPFEVFHTFMAPTKESMYRKPHSRAIVKDLSKMDVHISKKSMMIGDAGGRPNDHADSDLMFAVSLGIKFIHTDDIVE